MERKIRINIRNCEWKDGAMASYQVDVRDENVKAFVKRLKALLSRVVGKPKKYFMHYELRDHADMICEKNYPILHALPNYVGFFSNELPNRLDFGDIEEVIPWEELMQARAFQKHSDDLINDRVYSKRFVKLQEQELERLKAIYPRASPHDKDNRPIEKEKEKEDDFVYLSSPKIQHYAEEGKGKEKVREEPQRQTHDELYHDLPPLETIEDEPPVKEPTREEMLRDLIKQHSDRTEVTASMYNKYVRGNGLWGTKSLLVHLYQTRFGTDCLKVLTENLDRGYQKMFKARIDVSDLAGQKSISCGIGFTKQEAENVAAGVALYKLGMFDRKQTERIRDDIELFKRDYRVLFGSLPMIEVSELEGNQYLAEAKYYDSRIIGVGISPHEARMALIRNFYDQEAKKQ